MKIIEIMEKDEKPGTYAAVTFDKDTVDALKQYIQDNDIPNPVTDSSLHTTLLYSRKHLPDYKAEGEYDHAMTGKAATIEIWKSQPDENGDTSNVLVIAYKCDELKKRHKKLMDEHEATYDFDEYKPHVTLSYDAGDLEVKDLPKFGKLLKIVSEYQNELK